MASAGSGVADAEELTAEPVSSHSSAAVHAMALPPALRTEAERMQGEGCTFRTSTGYANYR